MSKPARPTLDSLANRFARKDPAVVPSPPPLPEVAETKPDAPPEAAPAKTGRQKVDPRVQILTRIDPATRRRLKVIAAEQERTIQEICEEAIRDFVARHSK